MKDYIKKLNFYDVQIGIKYIFALFLSFFIKPFLPSNIWLVSERGDEARDNGYYFYKYIRETHSEIDCFYLIKKKSADYHRVEKYKTIIEYGSFKHFIYYILSKVCISTHMYRYIPDYRVTQRLDKFFKFHKIRVFLQHGIIKDYHPYLAAHLNPLDLFCCGAVRECEFIRQSLGYSDDVAICTGLARYDTLNEFIAKKQVLMMPTWRGDLYQLSNDEFIRSDYFKAFQLILESSELSNKLKECGYQLIFYPHYEMQKYIKLFHTAYENIIIAEHDKFDVQTLLKESAILITDYSSVYFDFAYMKKPIIYYQFDKEIYHQRHYKKGYFDYERDGFGVITNESNVLDVIKVYLDKPEMPEKYVIRVDEFFGLHDQNNCNRIFENIERKLPRR